jgi:hypothetical protein
MSLLGILVDCLSDLLFGLWVAFFTEGRESRSYTNKAIRLGSG